MVKTRLFGLVLDERQHLPVGVPLSMKAVKFLKEICIKYAADVIDRQGLIPMRNAKATSMGLIDTVNVEEAGGERHDAGHERGDPKGEARRSQSAG